MNKWGNWGSQILPLGLIETLTVWLLLYWGFFLRADWARLRIKVKNRNFWALRALVFRVLHWARRYLVLGSRNLVRIIAFLVVLEHVNETVFNELVIEAVFLLAQTLLWIVYAVQLLVEAVDIPQPFGKHYGHLLIEVLVVLKWLFQSIGYELFCVSILLVNVSFQPGQVKFVNAESHQVEERLDIVNWVSCLANLKFSNASKHWVAFKSCDFVRVVNYKTLSIGKVN